jgi:Phage tail assembly chaperone proteins, E, or 41 or 14
MPQPTPAIPLRGAELVRASPANETLTLTQPIDTGSERITELIFRPLTPQDLRLYGSPVKDIHPGGGLTYDTQAVAQLLVALTGLPMATIDRLHPHDWLRAATLVAAFFRPPEPTS